MIFEQPIHCLATSVVYIRKAPFAFAAFSANSVVARSASANV